MPSRGKSGWVSSSYRRCAVALVVQRDGPDCFRCGKFVPENERSLDHAVAKDEDQSLAFTASNLRMSHLLCNMQAPRLWLLKTHCKYGHPYDEENSYFYLAKRRTRPVRYCKKCLQRRRNARIQS